MKAQFNPFPSNNQKGCVIEDQDISFTMPSNNGLFIVDLKNELANLLNARVDRLCLFSSYDKSLLSDNLPLKKCSSMSCFYSLDESTQAQVVIEYYQNNIDKVILNVTENASVFMLKHLLRKKLQIPIEEIGLMEKSKQKYLSDEDLVRDFQRVSTAQMEKTQACTSSVFSLNTNCESANRIDDIILVRKTKKSFSIGLDLTFAAMNNIKKIKFDEDAPNYREVSDGMSLFCYCKNPSCKIKGQMFVKKVGYGKFNILKIFDELSCLKCHDKKRIEARNIGFVNCEWNYKGYLSNKSTSFISGDGLTIDNKLYVLDNIHLSKQISQMEITVRESSIKFKCVDNSFNKGHLETENVTQSDESEEENIDEFSAISHRKKMSNFCQIQKDSKGRDNEDDSMSKIILDRENANSCFNLIENDKNYCHIF